MSQPCCIPTFSSKHPVTEQRQQSDVWNLDVQKNFIWISLLTKINLFICYLFIDYPFSHLVCEQLTGWMFSKVLMAARGDLICWIWFEFWTSYNCKIFHAKKYLKSILARTGQHQPGKGSNLALWIAFENVEEGISFGLLTVFKKINFTVCPADKDPPHSHPYCSNKVKSKWVVCGPPIYDNLDSPSLEVWMLNCLLFHITFSFTEWYVIK